MARHRKKKRRKSKTDLGPLDFMIDLAGAAGMNAYVRHKIKQDFKKGHGEESAKAAAIVYGGMAMRRGSAGMFGLGGLYGLNGALKDISKQEARTTLPSSQCTPVTAKKKEKPLAKPGVWRSYCEDGSAYGLNPEDFSSAEDYEDALAVARGETIASERGWSDSILESAPTSQSPEKKTTAREPTSNTWRNFCEDGSAYGLDPMDYSSADDYQDALNAAKAEEYITSPAKPVVEAQKSTPTNTTARELRISPIPRTDEGHKHTWRKYARDGSKYGLYPEDFQTADDYEDALERAENK